MRRCKTALIITAIFIVFVICCSKHPFEHDVLQRVNILERNRRFPISSRSDAEHGKISTDDEDSFTIFNSDEIHNLPELPRFTELEWEVLDTQTCYDLRKKTPQFLNDTKCDGAIIEYNFMHLPINVTSFKVFEFFPSSPTSTNRMNTATNMVGSVHLDHKQYSRFPVSRSDFEQAIKDTWSDMNVANTRVPNIGHAVHLFIDLKSLRRNPNMTMDAVCNFNYVQYVGYLSLLWIHRPRLYLIWLDEFPIESKQNCPSWWKFIGNVTSRNDNDKAQTRVLFITRNSPSHIFGNEIHTTCHQTDIIRMEALLLYGGIYTDSDTFVIRPFTNLMRLHNMVVGNHSTAEIGNAVILTERNNRFLRMWYATYQSFEGDEWGFHSMMIPIRLGRLLNHLMFLSTEGFYLFNYQKVEVMREKVRPWSSNQWIPSNDINYSNELDIYTFHLYPSNKVLVKSFETAIALDCLLGDICRYILLRQVTIPENTTPLKCTTK